MKKVAEILNIITREGLNMILLVVIKKHLLKH